MNLIANKKIAIVGGGPGGLTLARLLQLKGADVTVFERDLHKDARPKGATLDLHEESGLRALREGGLMDAFLANYRPGAELVRVIDQHATIVSEDLPTPQEEIARPEIDRGPLQRILLDSLQPGTVMWGSQFESLLPQGDGWRLVFKNGDIAYADLVIAADGANSKLRPYITPLKPFYSGIMVVEASVYQSEKASPRMHKLLNSGKIFAFGDSKSLIVSSKGDGSLVFYTGVKTGEDWVKRSRLDFTDRTEVLNWFKAEYDGWDVIWQELFVNAAVPFIPRPIYCMPLDQTWAALPNLTMLGDAAHLMPPFAGEGVNMAMLDALELSLVLTGNDFESLQAAIAFYEAAMRSRASEIAQESLDSGEMLHSPGAISFMANIGQADINPL